MREAIQFLQSFAHSLSSVALYPSGHGIRQRAVDETYQRLNDLFVYDQKPLFSFLGNEVVFGEIPLRELRDWEWSDRLAGIGMQRLEFDSSIPISREEMDRLLDDIVARLTARFVDSSEARQNRPTGIRYGTVGIGDESETLDEEVATATITFSLRDEADAVRWVHNELRDGNQLPMIEAQAIVRALSVAMHGDRQMLLPLLKLRQFDEYTTTHSLNVSVLAMGLAEWMGLGGRDVRAVGVSGLLHDLGKVKIPEEILNKPGRLEEHEREIMKSHSAEGARLILTSDEQLDLPAAVAYEHHIMINGGGYPTMRYPRDCHFASRLVHVCDVYDALRTKRPYRDPWPAAKVLAYIEERSGTEFDGTIAHAFTGMMHRWEPHLTYLEENEVYDAAQISPQSPALVDPAPEPPK